MDNVKEQRRILKNRALIAIRFGVGAAAILFIFFAMRKAISLNEDDVMSIAWIVSPFVMVPIVAVVIAITQTEPQTEFPDDVFVCSRPSPEDLRRGRAQMLRENKWREDMYAIELARRAEEEANPGRPTRWERIMAETPAPSLRCILD